MDSTDEEEDRKNIKCLGFVALLKTGRGQRTDLGVSKTFLGQVKNFCKNQHYSETQNGTEDPIFLRKR